MGQDFAFGGRLRLFEVCLEAWHLPLPRQVNRPIDSDGEHRRDAKKHDPNADHVQWSARTANNVKD